ncbi:hypothetical protein FRC03_004433 [Tulasnella sp. 419]|nr:hypothetical protein FRC03_004433 [Tulasnella sp. 419]
MNATLKLYAPAARIILYGTLFLWSFLLFCLCCARLAYTTTPRDEKSLFNGEPFHDPSIVELLISALFAMMYVPAMFWTIRKRYQTPVFAAVFTEVAILAVLWFFFVGGAGAASTVWPNLSSWCSHPQCQLLSAIIAFAWLAWITISLLLAGCVYFGFKNRSWTDPVCDSWGSTETRGMKV